MATVRQVQADLVAHENWHISNDAEVVRRLDESESKLREVRARLHELEKRVAVNRAGALAFFMVIGSAVGWGFLQASSPGAAQVPDGAIVLINDDRVPHGWEAVGGGQVMIPALGDGQDDLILHAIRHVGGSGL